MAEHAGLGIWKESIKQTVVLNLQLSVDRSLKGSTFKIYVSFFGREVGLTVITAEVSCEFS